MVQKDEEVELTKTIEESNKHVSAILQSKKQKKVVVAGPGTGKTFLFKNLLENKKNTLTLTFVNSLVEDLSLELYGMSEVRTLHSYARSVLQTLTKSDIKISPLLSKTIKEDALVLLDKDINFEKLFHELDDENEFVEFYKKRKDYYGYYGYSDVIYAAVKYFEKNEDKIPVYEQILIDEFQDFNKLEVSLIDILSTKSPILLAGDDDQALYEFKSASTVHIRDRNNGKIPEYESFNLPYCFRCTRSVVGAVNDIISAAQKAGFLSGRIEKPYTYFENEDKNKDSNQFPNISYSHKYDTQIPWFIEKKIKEMAELSKNNFNVLIISPIKRQSQNIGEKLKKKGLQNIDIIIGDELELSFLDGLKLLIEDINDNLGWRIVSRYLLKKEEFEKLLKTSNSYITKKIVELLIKEQKDEIKKILKVLKYIRDGKPIIKDDFDDMMIRLEIDFYGMVKEYLKNEIATTKSHVGDPGIRKIPIKSTTIQSSKGLAADLVFITHFDDRYFIKDNDKTKIADRDICNFLVAMTRTKKKLYLISTVIAEPTFLKWINKDRLETITN